MKKKNNTTTQEGIIERLAPRIGAKILREPNWGSVYQITFKNGTKRYARYNKLDINPMGSSELAMDKDYSNFFMKSLGYPTIPGRAFYSKSWAKAIGSKDTIDYAFIYAKRLGFPLIVKPNSKSQGKGVAVVSNKTEFYKALKHIFTYDRVALVQERVFGHDYRIVVLGNKIISAYERLPLSIVGDGISSIEKLFHKKKKLFNSIDRDMKIKITDTRIKNKLKEQKCNLSSVLKKGEQIYLLDNANLSQGGDSIDVTESINPSFKKIAISLTRDMGLTLCGVDIITQGTIQEKPKVYHVIEVNSAPGLDHYVTTGPAQEKIVEDLYLEVLKSMEK